MLQKSRLLMILILLNSGILACSFKLGSEKAAAEPNSDKDGKNANVTIGSSTENDLAENPRLSDLSGTYRYRSGNYNNTINVKEQGNNRLRVALFASYEYKINGEMNANVGEAKGIATLNGDTAVLVPDDADACEISLKFFGNEIIVKTKNEFEN